MLKLIARRFWQRVLWKLDWQLLEGEERLAVLRLIYRLEARP